MERMDAFFGPRLAIFWYPKNEGKDPEIAVAWKGGIWGVGKYGPKMGLVDPNPICGTHLMYIFSKLDKYPYILPRPPLSNPHAPSSFSVQSPILAIIFIHSLHCLCVYLLTCRLAAAAAATPAAAIAVAPPPLLAACCCCWPWPIPPVPPPPPPVGPTPGPTPVFCWAAEMADEADDGCGCWGWPEEAD